MDTKKMTPTIDNAQYPPVLREANEIIEDFPLSKQVVYFMLFALETALVFWLALSM